MNKIWQIRDRKYSNYIDQLLYNRGIINSSHQNEKISKFVDPDFDTDFHSPCLLPDYNQAIKRIKLAIINKEKIGIYADYDADGIPGAALLYKTLNLFGIETIVYIPTRDIGYGFNIEGIDHLISGGCKLIISVDLGIKEFEISNYIKQKGIDLIITDHHIAEEKLPEAVSVINPKILNSKYPFKELSGAGVVYKIIQGLSLEYPDIIDEKFLKWNLDLVAISTISDVVPLLDENRLFAKFGLLVLRKTKNIGLQAIYSIAGINPEKVDSYNVGFQIGPRINAPGRIDNANISFQLLTTGDEKQANILAKEIERSNSTRQESMEKVMSEAVSNIERNNLLKNKMIILCSKSWSKGVIGPVASNLIEKFSRPIILFVEEEDYYVGSARSISNYNIVEAIEKVSEFTLSFGGHSGAAGLKVDKKNFANFLQNMIENANNEISEKDLLPKITIDLELEKEKINLSVFKKILNLEPFGLGNPKPIFVTKKLRLKSSRFVGKEEKHLQMQFSAGVKNFKGILFNHKDDGQNLEDGRLYDIVYYPSLNFWNGKWWTDLQIIDYKFSEENE